MRINVNSANPVESANASDSSQALKGASPSGQTPKSHQGRHRGGAGDHVQISDVAKQLAATDPSVLDRLQAAIQSGSYNVSPAQIAKSIISAHLTES